MAIEGTLGYTTYALHDIEAEEELLVDYGTDFFKEGCPCCHIPTSLLSTPPCKTYKPEAEIDREKRLLAKKARRKVQKQKKMVKMKALKGTPLNLGAEAHKE